MKFKLTIWLLCIFSAPYIAGAQSEEVASEAQYRSAAEAMVMLQNRGNLVPLQRLDSLRIAYFDLNDSKESTLEKYLSKYTAIATPGFPDGLSAEAAGQWAAQQAAFYDLFIFGLRDDGNTPLTPGYLQYHFLLRALLQQSRSIVLSFGNERPYTLMPWFEAAQTWIHTPASDFWAESLAAQAVFGGAAVQGTLQKALGTTFPAGTGLKTEGGLRLQYAPPSIVGMDAVRLRDSIAAIVQQGIAGGAYPGAQVLVARNGYVVFHEAFGHHTFEQSQPVRLEDIYDFASVTKISSGLPAAMRLYGEGKFDLDAPMRKYLPDFAHSNKADLTFRQMLAHNARLLAWIPFWRGTLRGNAHNPWQKRWQPTMANTGDFKARTFSNKERKAYPVFVADSLWLHRSYKNRMLRSIRRSPLNEKPGYVYSDLSFYLWPEIIPRLTGLEFQRYLKETFYHPMGAYTLTYNPLEYFPRQYIVPTERDTFFRKVQLHGTVHDEGAAMLGGISGHAGLFGAANDLAKLMQMYMNGGTYGGQRFIRKAALEEFTRCAYCEEGIHRGLGFDRPLPEYDTGKSYTARSASQSSFGHSGYTGTFTWADPESGLLLIFFSNRVFPTRDNRKLYELGIRPRLHQSLYDAILK